MGALFRKELGVPLRTERGSDRRTELIRLIATLGYSGYVPVAPGTAGSAVAMGIYLLLLWMDCHITTTGWIVSLVVTYGLGVYTATVMEREWGEDPGPVVIDEGLGYLVTVAWLPPTVSMALVAFFLFRALDILKPAPARQSERLPGGWGVMTDDFIAGVYGNVLIRLGLWVIVWWGG